MNANGGIYCIIPLGDLYNTSLLESVRWRLRRFLGVKIKGLSNESLDFTIAYVMRDMMLGLMNMEDNSTYKQYASSGQWIGDNGVVGRLQENIRRKMVSFAEEIASAYGFAIYHDGKRVAIGQRGKDEFATRYIYDFFDANQSKSKLKSMLSKKGWAIMIAVAHPVAARFEAAGIYPDRKYQGQGQIVLKSLAMDISRYIRTRLGRKASGLLQYGYILSRNEPGYAGRPFQVI